MIIIKSKDEIDLMRESGKVTGYVLRTLADIIKPGISTMDINNYVEKTITGYNMTPTFRVMVDFREQPVFQSMRKLFMAFQVKTEY